MARAEEAAPVARVEPAADAIAGTCDAAGPAAPQVPSSKSDPSRERAAGRERVV